MITHRYDVLARFGRSLKTTWMEELAKLKAKHLTGLDASAFGRWLHGGGVPLPAYERAHLNHFLSRSNVLATVYSMREPT